MANADATINATPSRTLPLAAALKEAVLSGFVAFGLFFFMIGLRTEQGSTGALEITTRFQTFAILVAAVFEGSFLRTLMFGRGAIPLGRAVPPSVARLFGGASRFAGPALLIFALLVPVLFYHNRYLLDLGILVLTYVMLGWGLNIVVGLAGLLDLGYVAFYAVGAYSYALIATNFGLSFWICLPISGLMKPWRVAKNDPAKPPNIAPMAKAVSFTLMVLMPSERQAISFSRNASQARPIGSRRSLSVKALVTSASSRIR